MNEINVTKFDGINDFQVWRVQIQAYLEANALFKMVNGVMLPGNEHYERFNAKAEAALLTIMEIIVVRAVKSLQSAKEMWERLSSLYDQESRFSVSVLLQEFYFYKMTEDMGIASHIAKVESMAHRLKELGEDIEEDEIIGKLLQLEIQALDFCLG